MSAPPIAERHRHHFHRQSPIKEAVRAATTANITISTALNNGDSLDGLTLATGDRVLVKDQSTGSQNGIYTVGASPARDYDESTDDPGFGFLVYVREGTTNGGTLWKNTNTSAPTIGTTALTFAQFTGGALTDHTHAATGSGSNGGGATLTPGTLNLPTATSPSQTADGQAVWDSDDDKLTIGTGAARKTLVNEGAATSSGLTMATDRLLGRTTASAGAIEEISVGTGLSLSAGSLSATGGGTGTLTTIEEVDGSPTDNAVTKLVFPNGTLSIVSHVATYTPAGVGGGVTHAYVGYDTIGGSTENVVSLRQYMKKVTLASAAMVTSVSMYVKQITTNEIMSFAVAILTDSAGSPALLIAQGQWGSSVNGQGAFLATSGGSAGAARWLHAAVGTYLTAGDYWIAAQLQLQAANSHQVYYDGSGGDRYYTNGGHRMSDAGWTTVTTSSNKYSLRASTIS